MSSCGNGSDGVEAGRPRVAVIIPALNEEKAIGLVLRDIPRNIVDQVVVVDNGSTDGTALMAESLGATVRWEPERGYGAACLKGIESWGRTSRSWSSWTGITATIPRKSRY